MAEPITHLEKTIAGEVTPVTHLEQVIAEYGGGNINEQLVAGTNILIEETADGKAKISASGEVSSEDTVARAEIAAIKDGTTLDSFGDVETALGDKQNTISDLSTIRSGAALGATAVQPETGKGLSTNDYTTTEKTKLAGIAEGAEVNEIEGIKVNSTTVNPDANKVVNITVPTSAADVSALPDTTKYAAALSLTINSSTFVMTGQLKDQNGDNLGTAQTIDLPLESVVVGGSYDSQTKKVVLTLQNGNTIEFSVADLVSGLQTELSASNKLNPAYINYDSTHRAVSDTEKSTWNSKQTALDSTQLAAVNSGITSADVAQITINENNILSNYGGTIDKNILNTTITVANENDVTFTLNDDKSITVNGTNRFTTAAIPIELGSFTPITGKTYVCKGTGNANIKIQVFDGTGLPANSSNDATFTAQAGATYSVRVWIAAKPASGTQFNNLKIYPMICEQSIYTADSSYQPYILSNREASDAIQAIQSWIAAQS